MALAGTLGVTLNPFNYREQQHTAQNATWMQGQTSAATANDGDVTLSAFGALSSTSQFHLTDVWVTLNAYTVTTSYNILFNGTTIAGIAPKAGGNITASVTKIFRHLDFGIPGLMCSCSTDTQTLAMVMSGATATGTAAIISAKGYFGNLG